MKKTAAAVLAFVMVMLCAISVSFGEISGVAAGDIVTFGRYPQTEEGTDETPIEWIVLDVQDGKALLLSRYGLETKQYNSTGITNNSWETCTLRIWLNEDFLNKAFNEREQAAIQITDVDNSTSQNWSVTGGDNTQDRIFLLGCTEANQYLSVKSYDHDGNNMIARVAPTAYAIAQGAWADDSNQTTDGNAAGWWWLRSLGSSKDRAAYVCSDGSLDYVSVYRNAGIVRPAMWISLE